MCVCVCVCVCLREREGLRGDRHDDVKYKMTAGSGRKQDLPTYCLCVTGEGRGGGQTCLGNPDKS